MSATRNSTPSTMSNRMLWCKMFLQLFVCLMKRSKFYDCCHVILFPPQSRTARCWNFSMRWWRSLMCWRGRCKRLACFTILLYHVHFLSASHTYPPMHSCRSSNLRYSQRAQATLYLSERDIRVSKFRMMLILSRTMWSCVGRAVAFW